MEDEGTKEEIQPSTSKKDSLRSNSRNDLYDDKGHDERGSNTESSVTATYSARSRIEMVDARLEPPKPSTLGKREPKAPEKKKRARRGGRVEKRRRSFRRQVRRAPMRRKQGVARRAKVGERRPRERSMSTIFSRLSSTGSRSPGCVHCGHRCCRRRYEYKVLRDEYLRKRCRCRRCRKRRMPKKRMVRVKQAKKKALQFLTPQFTVFSKEIQTGSRSHMLSPLFINTNSAPEAEVTLPEQTYSEVTPEMIFESLCVLNLWRQDVHTALVLKYIMRNYPVNREEGELYVELSEKLRIAAIVGFVTQTSEDFWALAGELEQRRLTATHVTLFWKTYSDTLRPISRKEPNLQRESSELPSKTTRGLDSWDNNLI